MFAALSGSGARDSEDIRVVPNMCLQRSRLDTLDEMELLGQGKYGEGNQPLISSKTRDGDSDESIP